MNTCRFQVGDLLKVENSRLNCDIYIVIGDFSNITMRVQNVRTGRIDRLPLRWFTKL